MVKPRIHFFLPFFLFALGLGAGCSLPWSKPAPVSNPTAAKLLQQGNANLAKKEYKRAIMQFEQIRQDFPFSEEANEVELRIGEAYYRNKQYADAAQAFKSFLSLRPTHKEVPFVLYHLGLVYFDQFNGVDRDQKNIETAIPYFEKVIKQHAASPYAPKAKLKISQCREYLAEHEMYVASFYMTQKKYAAAQERFENVVRNYLNTPQGVQALFQLGESYRLRNNTIRAALAYEALIKHYPNSSLAQSARVELSRLDQKRRDPLAELLQDNGPVLVVADDAGDPLAVAPDGSGKPRETVLVAKTEVVHEEGGNPKGFFTRLASAVNPFDSSDDEKKDSAPENTKGPAGESNGHSTSSEKGFFGRIADTLNPFASSNDNNGTGKSGSDGKVQQAEVDPKLLGSIDSAMKKDGLETAGKNTTPTPPDLKLPPNLPEPAPPDLKATKAMLSKIDKELQRDGKEVAQMPAVPDSASIEGDKTTAQAKASAAQTKANSAATKKLLGAIDEQLNSKNFQPPTLETASPEPSQAASSSPPPPAAPKAKTVELSPRLSTGSSPFLLDHSEFQGVKNQPSPEPSKKQEKSAQTAASSDQLSDSVLEEPSYVPPKKKEPEEKKTGDQDVTEDDSLEGAVGQVKDEVGVFQKLLKPFGW